MISPPLLYGPVVGYATGMGPRAWLGLVVLVVLLVAMFQVPRYLRAASVLLATVKIEDPGLTKLVTRQVTVNDELLMAQGQELDARMYAPTSGGLRGAVLLVHGIHPEGIDERRFMGFAHALASVGHLVMTPSLPELSSLEATPDTITRIAAAASALSAQARCDVVAIGISVGGGLTLLAAARQQGHSPIGRVVGIGSHEDLVRVARHYAGITATDINGNKALLKPHPYGIQVLAYAHAGHFFSTPDVAKARALLALYLDQKYSAARKLIGGLSATGQVLMHALLEDPSGPLVVERLRLAIDHVQEALRAVSPAGRLDALQVPVMLLHGESDPIIPATELSWLAKDIPPDKLMATLVTPVLTHTDFPDGASALDFVAVVRFVARMLPPP